MFLTSGCIERGDVDLLEARLRETQDQLLTCEHQLSQTKHELVMSRGEADALRQQLSAGGQNPLLPEHFASLHSVSGIRFNTLFTAVRARENSPGEPVLQAVLIPHDADGDLVKLVGQVEIEAFDFTLPGEDKRIGKWTFGPEEARRRWHSGFLSSGYQFDLPWTQPPQSEEILLHARLITADGRHFDVNHTLRIKGPHSGSDRPADIVTNASAQHRHETHYTPREIPELPLKPPAFESPVVQQAHAVGADRARPDEEPGFRRPRSATPPTPPAGTTVPKEPSLMGRAVQTSDAWTDDSIPFLR